MHPKDAFVFLILLRVCVASPVTIPFSRETIAEKFLAGKTPRVVGRYTCQSQNNRRTPCTSRHYLDVHTSSLMLFGGSVLNQLPVRNSVLVLAGLGFLVHRQCSRSKPFQRATYFWWRVSPIIAHYKFTALCLKLQNADAEKRQKSFEKLHNRYADPTLDVILRLKGLYIKLGQVLSARPDFMPPQYIRVFTTLQDNVPAVPGMKEVAMEALETNCGEALKQYDAIEWDPVPLGSASIGQVHRAVLIQGKQNTTVAVKVMRPGSEMQFQHDFSVFRWLCRIAIPSWKGFLHAFHEQVKSEFDYENEAQSLNTVRENMKRSPYGRRVHVPYALTNLCCRNVLVMEMLHGKRLADAIKDHFVEAMGGNETAASEFLSQRKEQVMTGKTIPFSGIDELGWPEKFRLWRLSRRCTGWIELLVKIHGHQIFCDGVWNGDPHFGNLLQLDSGRLGLIDYGQTRSIDDELRKAFANIVVILHEDGDNTARIAVAMEGAGFRLRDPSDHETMAMYGHLMFDSDVISEQKGYTIPQEYFKHLMEKNPLVNIPDSSIFVARTSLMFRGMGSAVGMGQIRTASRWYEHAKRAVDEPST